MAGDAFGGTGVGTIIAVLASFMIGGEAPLDPDEQDASDRDEPAEIRAVSFVHQPTAEAENTETEPDTEPEQEPDAERWLGRIELPGAVLDFAVTIRPSESGWSGAIDIPAQNVAGLPLHAIKRTNDRIAFAAELPGLPEANWPTWSFDIDEGGGSAAGELRQSGMRFESTLRLADSDEPILRRPQHPTGPQPYRSIELAVPVETAAGSHTLSGTLTLPDADAFGPGPYPAAILITGSGPQDRDESIMGHKPFLVIAHHLATRGIATLRCDDRGVGGSGGEFEGATSFDFADDVRAQVDALVAHEAIGSVGLIGHSEGALVAPIVAADSEGHIDWLVLLAGPGVPGREVLAEQFRAIYRADQGITDAAALDAMIAAQQAAFDATLAGDQAAARSHITELVELEYTATNQDPDGHREQVTRTIDETLAALNGPWFTAFLTLDPREYLRRVQQPVLVLNGSLDTQVLHDQNVPAIADSLAEGGNGSVTVRVLEGLNHLFQPATTGGVSEYGTIETTFDEAALTLIADWINEQPGQ
ncbi:MAG: alpha/beta fold hydrolase [Planctomycetota bacterium]